VNGTLFAPGWTIARLARKGLILTPPARENANLAGVDNIKRTMDHGIPSARLARIAMPTQDRNDTNAADLVRAFAEIACRVTLIK
jgi:hypothetical protein